MASIRVSSCIGGVGLLVALATGSTAHARPASTDPALAPIAELIAAINSNAESKVAALFTPDAVVFDEVSPYRWVGPKAALGWFHDDGALIRKNGIKNPRVSIDAPTFVHRSATSVYTVSPLVDAYVYGGRPQRETGLLTVIVVKRGSVWKISLMGFAKQSDTRDVSWESQ